MLRPLRPVLLLAATLTLALPSLAGAATIFFDDFDRDSGPVVGNGWIESEDGNWDVRIRHGRMRLRDGDDFPSVTRSVDTSGFADITISFEYESFATDGNLVTESDDLLTLLYDSGSGLEALEVLALGNDDEIFSVAFALPDSASDNPDLTTRLALTVSTDGEGVWIDDFRVSGTPIPGGGSAPGPTSAMPEPSAALVFGLGLLTLRSRLRRRA